MNEIKHTPGPWFVVDNGTYLEIRTASGRFEGEQIGDLCASKYIDGIDDNPVAEQNALLFAVAPDALMALELIAADADAGNSRLTSGVRMALDAALIKAGRKAAPEPVRHITVAGRDL